MNFRGIKASGNSRIHAGNIYNTAVADNQEDRITKVLQSLSSDYVEHLKAVEPKVSGTCEWFITNEQYLAWRNSNVSSVLLVSADPGCGKSVLSRWLVEESLKEDNVAGSKTCYFFFKDGLEGRAQGSDAVRAILHQLLRRLDSPLVADLLPEFESHGDKIKDKIEELWEILCKIPRLGAGMEIICFIDALDECEQHTRARLLKAIVRSFSSSENAGSSNARFKFLLTTRPYEDIISLFRTPHQVLNVIRFDGTEHTEEIARDIDLVIDEKVPHLATSFPQKLQEHLKQSLRKIPHRTYLWLYLMLDVIEYGLRVRKTVTHVDQILSELPQSITSAYSAILRRCQDRDKAIILLKIVVAATRPLTVHELNIAYEYVNSHNRRVSFHLDCEDDDSFKHTIRTICGLFLTIYDSKVFLFHQTARAYLLHASELSCDDWQHFTEIEAHLVLAQVCLNHLDSVVKDYSLHAYAAINWIHHFQCSEWHHSHESVSRAARLCSPNTSLYRTWFSKWYQQDTRPYGIFYANESETDIVVASMLDLPSVVDALIRQGIAAKAPVAYYAEALYKAVYFGYDRAIEILLATGANTNPRGLYYSEVLCAVSRSGKEKLVRMLLAAGADVNAWVGIDGHALCEAAVNGHTEIVELLLRGGADIHACGRYHRNALYLASQEGWIQVVDVLLANGANVNASTVYDGHALYGASLAGCSNVVKLLLAAGANVNNQGGEYGSALQAASVNNHKETVQLLLAAGADVNAQGGRYGNALQAAIENSHWTIVERLEIAGAVVLGPPQTTETDK